MELDPCDHNHTSIQLHTLMIQYTLKSLGKQMNRGMKKYKICKVVFSKCWLSRQQTWFTMVLCYPTNVIMGRMLGKRLFHSLTDYTR